MVLSDLIFVYGTLLSAVPSAASKWLQQHARLLGEASFPGMIYDLGAYPGFVSDPSVSCQVVGEVYQLYAAEKAFSYLDKYEGLDEQVPLYRREKLTHAGYGTVWTYIYQGETTDLSLIAGGDYRNFFEQQARHRLFIRGSE